MSKRAKKFWMVKQGKDDGEHLATSNAYCESSRLATDRDMTPVAIADMLDHDAENGNWHAFVGCHVKLAQLLTREVGKSTAARIMRRIVDMDGLHGMNS